MRKKGDAKGKAYMEQMFAKWTAYRGVATRQEAIHNKIDGKLRADCAKLDADLKKWKAEMLKAYEKKRMAERKADQERSVIVHSSNESTQLFSRNRT
jgi:hypothetical protein